MFRGVAIAILLTTFPIAGLAQELEFAPQTYDVTLYRWDKSTSASFNFLAPSEAETDVGSGDFEATIDVETLTGTWYAFDLGILSFWFVEAAGESQSMEAAGWSAPGFVVGNASLGPTDSRGGLLSWLRLFRTRYLLIGQAVEAPPPSDPEFPNGPGEPMEPMGPPMVPPMGPIGPMGPIEPMVPTEVQ